METLENELDDKRDASVSLRMTRKQKRKLEDEARELGLTTTDYLSILLQKKELKVEKNEPAKKTQIEKETDSLYLQEVVEKHDTMIELLERIADSGKANTAEDSKLKIEDLQKQVAEKEEELKKEFTQQLFDQEEKLRTENVMLQYNEIQKKLIVKLIAFRKEAGAKFSDRIEDFFFFIFNYYLNNTWDEFPDGFKKEFKTAFADFINPKKEAEESPAK
jgi:hypothetical protein